MKTNRGEVTRREFVVLSAGVAVSAALAACGGTAAPASSGAAAASAKPGSASAAAKGKETAQIVVAVQGGGQSMDPARSTAIEDWAFDQQVYNALLRYKPGGYDLEPDLAESWEKSKDGKQYTFKLKKGIQFHKGFGELTSADVKFSIDRHSDPNFPSVHRGFLWMLDSIDAPDKYTVVFNLKQPFAPFLSNIAMNRPPAGVIISKAAADKLGLDDYSDHPIGTGPFIFDSQVPNQSRTLTRNDAYHEGPALAKSVKFVNLTDSSTLGLAIEKAEVHIANARGADLLTKYKDSKAAQLFVGTVFETAGAMVNTSKPPFNKVEVRQALSHAVNAEEIVQGALAGFGVAANAGLLIPGQPGYDDSLKPVAYDPEKAKAMLAAAGVQNLKIVWITYTGEPWTTTGALLKEQFRRAGVDLTVQQLERGALETKRRDKSIDGTIISFTTGPDPDTMLRYYTSAQFPPGYNDTWYGGADKQVDASERAQTDEERATAVKQAQQQLATDIPELPFFHQKGTVLASTSFQGYKADPLGGFWLREAWLS